MSKQRRRGLALLGALLLAPISIYAPSLWAKAQAKRDVAHGYYHITEYGLHAGDFRVYQGLMLKRYGVHVNAGGCVLPANYDQVDAYNQVVRDTLNRKYHHNIFAECASASLPHSN